MMKIEKGNIIEGQSIGSIKIGMKLNELSYILNNNYELEERTTCKILILENAKLWFDKEENLYQIGVFGNFEGKYEEKIGIGSTLTDVGNFIGEYEEEFDVYILKNCPGICFELEDVEDWDEKSAPIEFIYVFKV